ncbi:MAG TPA: MraY family glycosyltransferase, partial [Acidimicrobiia bacterium]|nr:MraY family glycosyltransferase [Acidimicrobiia bacterium]
GSGEGSQAMTLDAGLAAVVALAATTVLTPLFMRVALRLRVIDAPGGRKIHALPTPLLGGAAITIGISSGVAVFAVTSGSLSQDVAWVAVGIVLAAGLGLIDDLRPLSALPKFTGQATIALLVVRLADLTIIHLPNPAGADIAISGAAGTTLAVIWIVAIMNAFNMVDGLDGLAAGVGAVSGGAITALALWAQAPIAIALGTTVTGSLIAFLRWNYHPARVFMGDLGSMAIGFALATAGLGLAQGPAPISLVTVVLLLGLPVLDLCVSVTRRIIAGRNPLKADRDHLHHILMDRGVGQSRTVLDLYLLATAMAGLGFLVGRFGEYPVFGAVRAGAFFLIPAGVVIVLGARQRQIRLAAVPDISPRKAA